MILHCNYEELNALKTGAKAILGGDPEGGSSVIAPPEERARVEALVPRLKGDLSLGTLADLVAVSAAVDAIVQSLRVEMEAVVVRTHAAHEGAVAAYFDFAHALSVSQRLRNMRDEMEALIEVVTGASADEETAKGFRFPD